MNPTGIPVSVRRARFVLATLLCAGAWALPSSSFATGILGVRTGDDVSRTRLVLDLDGPASIPVLEEEGSNECTFLLPSYDLPSSASIEIEPEGRIAGGNFTRADDLRLTLRFTRPCRVDVFLLEHPSRLVLDVVEREGTQAEPKEPRPSEEGAGVSIPFGSEDSQPVDPAPEPKRTGPRVVVIDAGHGGDDPGAVGPGVREKDVCLDVARRLHKELSAREGVHPVLTRSRDVLLPLRSRMRLAEEADADLFVSIHVNAAPTANADGVEVFFLSIVGASDEAAREAARYENELSLGAEPAVDEMAAEIPFSLSLRQSDTLLRSSRAAEVVLDLFVDRELARNRGVRQANFSVLRSYQVPSILVELGFVSSPSDREHLASAEHRGRLAVALADGIVRYFEQYAPLRRAEAH